MFQYDGYRLAVSEQPCTDTIIPNLQPHLLDY